ncbi:MAG: hypothetical protein RLY58_1855 [Pseudomonadota bacterium]|jgi:hypothetical protein
MIGVKWCFAGTGVGWLCLVGLKNSCVYAGLTILKFYRILGVLFLICACGGDCGACQGDGCGGCTGGCDPCYFV